jgi:hypothetical protein
MMAARRAFFLWLAIYMVGISIAQATGFHMAIFTIAWIFGGMAVYAIHPK